MAALGEGANKQRPKEARRHDGRILEGLVSSAPYKLESPSHLALDTDARYSFSSLTLVFSNIRGETYALGPLTQIHLRKRELRETADGAVLATAVDSRWHTEGGRFLRFDCDNTCHVTLERANGDSVRYGPYRHFSSLNGLKFTDHHLFCNYDEQQEDWYGHDSGQHWDAISVMPAAG